MFGYFLDISYAHILSIKCYAVSYSFRQNPQKWRPDMQIISKLAIYLSIYLSLTIIWHIMWISNINYVQCIYEREMFCNVEKKRNTKSSKSNKNY